ncbi:hypothetical protein CFY87_01195 [Actinobacillus seminis]|uniref:ESPR domain-containing protein n=2 Tax=Actinobacillus seminis TaxID=722 RepID=A0ABX4FR31_9PAST|nr:hypothetical protein CFY87_01195 [Actinobacillus seminis]
MPSESRLRRLELNVKRIEAEGHIRFKFVGRITVILNGDGQIGFALLHFYLILSFFKEDSFMNKVFKLIWNHAKQGFDVTSELTRSQRKNATTDNREKPAKALLVAGLSLSLLGGG